MIVRKDYFEFFLLVAQPFFAASDLDGDCFFAFAISFAVIFFLDVGFFVATFFFVVVVTFFVVTFFLAVAILVQKQKRCIMD